MLRVNKLQENLRSCSRHIQPPQVLYMLTVSMTAYWKVSLLMHVYFVNTMSEYVVQPSSYSELLPFSKNFSNPATNSVFVSSTAFLMDPPVEEMYEKSNSSKSSTFDRKQFQKLQQRKRNTTERSTEQNLLFYYNHSRIIGIWILHRLTGSDKVVI